MNQAYLSGWGGEWQLDKDEFVIGRAAPAALVVPRPPISREHARITRTAHTYYIADLGSRNGTFVNGEPVGQTPRRLISGDEIVLGGAVTFRFYDPAETAEGARIGRLNGIWIDESRRAVWVDGRAVEPPLSAAQFTLLARLYRAPGQVVSRDEIVAAVWADVAAEGVSEEAIDGLIKRLRARLRQAQPARDYIEVVRGQGVRLTQPL